jgi:hypothetical protein
MKDLSLVVAAALAIAGCTLPPSTGRGEVVGTIDVDGPNAYLDRAPTRDGAPVHLGDHVSTGPGTSVRVLLRMGGFVQLDENTDPDFFREAGCLVVQLFTGRIFVDGSGVCVRGPDFAGRQNSRVQYSHVGGRTQIVVLDGSTTLQRPTMLTLVRYDFYSITGGRPDGPPRRLTPQQAEALVAWGAKYFRVRGAPTPPPPPSPSPPQPEVTGFCCLRGGVSTMTAGRCRAAGGTFYTDEKAARNACIVIK